MYIFCDRLMKFMSFQRHLHFLQQPLLRNSCSIMMRSFEKICVLLAVLWQNSCVFNDHLMKLEFISQFFDKIDVHSQSFSKIHFFCYISTKLAFSQNPLVKFMSFFILFFKIGDIFLRVIDKMDYFSTRFFSHIFFTSKF